MPPEASRLRVVTVVGTRPEIIRLSRVIAAFDREFDHFLIHTGQNYDYELSEIFFTDLGVRKPNHFLEAAGSTAAETIGNVIAKVDALLRELKPSALLVLGDTNSCLAAIPAKRLRIPVFHMEAGNRCFDDRVPEEINRRIVDHTADINLPYSDISREYLLREGLPADRIIKTGSPMFEVLEFHRDKIARSDILSRLKLQARRYMLVSAHREENVDSPSHRKRFFALLEALPREYGVPVIVSTHPRTRAHVEREAGSLPDSVRFEKPFGFTDYVHLQQHAMVVLSDSGTISEESSILNFPALNIRDAHERPEAMEEGAVMLTGFSLERVRQGLTVLKTQGRGVERTLRPVADYTMPNVSEKIVRIVLSYTDYVRRTVWKESGA